MDAYEGVRAERLRRQSDAGVVHYQLDLEDADAVRAAVAELEPEFWVQHAGWAVNYASADYDIVRARRLDIDAQQPLFKALAEVGCRGLVLTGTCAEYGSSGEAHEETEVCEPGSPYGESKLASTLETKRLSAKYGLPARVARLFFPFGKLDAPGKLIPSVLAALERGEKLPLTDCTQVRDPTCMPDLVLGYEALIRDAGDRGGFEIFNLCSGEPVSLRLMLETLVREGGYDPSLLAFGDRPQRAGDDAVLFGSARKARDELGWQCRPLAAAVATLFTATG